MNDKKNREPMVIALATGKGGSMKTTSAVFLACALVDQSQGEQHVLVADADVQGDAKDWWYRAAELDLALQIPDAVAVLMHYSRLDETQRAAALVLMESAGRGQPQTIDGKGSPLEMPQETDDAGDDEDADMADADA